MPRRTAQDTNPRKLTAKMEAFCQHFVLDGNGTNAARLAGYAAPGNRAAVLMADPRVSARIAELRGDRLEEHRVTVERVIQELGYIAFARISDVAKFGSDGVVLKESEDLSPDVLAAVSEVSERQGQYGSSLKAKMHDKVRALELLGKHLGMFQDMPQVLPAVLQLQWKKSDDDEDG